MGFTPQIIYAGPHPNWGSSGMDVADVDGDGDLDVLLAHGDTLDDGIAAWVEIWENQTSSK